MSSRTEEKAALQQLTERIEALQAEGQTLKRQVASTGALVERHERMLDDLQRGIFAGRRKSRFLIWISAVLLLIAGFIAYGAWLTIRNRPDTSQLGLEQPTPIRPHLLITSAPAGAEIFVDGAPRGRTPKLLPSPHRSGKVKVSVRRGTTRSKTFVIKPTGGVHWHAKLDAP